MGCPCMLWVVLAAMAAAPPAGAEAPVRAVVPTVPAVPPKTDEAVQRARTADAKAREAYASNDVRGAADHAERAFRTVPNAATALIWSFYLGKLPDPQSACRALEAALIAADLDPTPDELRRIDRQLAEVGQRCGGGFGWVRLQVSRGGAQATVDGGDFIELPRTIALSAGAHDIVVTAPGQKVLEAQVNVVSGRQAVLALNLTPEAEPPEPIRLSSVGWGLLGTGLVLLGGSVGAHVWGLQAADEANANALHIPGVQTTAREKIYNDAAADAELGRILAGVGYGLAGASLVAAVVLLAVDEGDQPAISPTPTGAAVTLPF